MAEEEKTVNNKTSVVKKKRSVFHKTVNVFLYIFLGIFLLVLVVLGITQTSTFREYARETILEQINGELNGKLYIEKLEGTILTSVILRNTNLTLGQDTLLKAALIEVRTSPLQLLFKRIQVRKVVIRDAEIALIEDKNGELNISKLTPPTEEDTTTSDFPFTINIADLSLENVSFSLQSYDLAGSSETYDSLYMKDFRINDLNISMAAFADLSNNNFEVGISGFSFRSNINGILLNEISGMLSVNQEGITADNLVIRTGRSNIDLDAYLHDINIFDSTSSLSHALLDLNITADKFDFADLYPFVPSIDFIKEAVYLKMASSGSMKELDISQIRMEFLATQIALNGSIKNLDDPENMFISVRSEESHIYVKDINSLMPSLNLPEEYNRAGTVFFDTLHYDGTPSNFKTHFFARTDIGNLYASSLLDFRNEEMSYDVFFRTYNLDISPFAGVSSDLNSNGELKGTGTDPNTMNAIFNFQAAPSTIDGKKISQLELKSDARNSIINYVLYTSRDSSDVQLQGYLDLTNNNPVYEFRGFGNNINISDYTGDTTLTTNLNFNLDAVGESFSLEDMNLFLNLNLFNSELNGKGIDSTRAIVDLRKEDSGERVINIISDLADISITGNYSLEKSISLINKEVELLSSIITDRLNKIMPLQDSVITTTVQLAREDIKEFKTAQGDTATTIKYLIDLKDFELAALFLENSQLEINGEMFGDLYNRGDSIFITFGIDLDYVKYRTPGSAMFLSNLNLDLSLNNNLTAESLDDFSASLNLNVDRLFAGNDVRDLSLNLTLEGNKSYFNFFTNYDGNTSARLAGGIGISDNIFNIVLDTLHLNYKNLAVVNDEQVRINYSDDRIQIENFNLIRNGSSLSLKGFLAKSGEQDLIIRIDSLNIGDILADGFDTRPENNLIAMLNMTTQITGTMQEPVIDMKMNIDSVTFRGKNFGSLITNVNYDDRDINLKIHFIEFLKKSQALLITGNIPMDLSLADADTNFVPGPMQVSLKADNFDLGAFGDILPEVNRLNGFFSASLNVTGTADDLQPTGYFALKDVSFIPEVNNLIYKTGLKVTIDEKSVIIDSLVIQNGSDVPDGGTITGSGKADLDGLSLTNAEFSLSGRLKVLSDNSRYATAPVYGDLVIATRGNIEFEMNEDRIYLKAPIDVKKADLTIPPTQGSYSNTNRNFVYKFVQDTIDTARGRMDFESLVAYNQRLNGDQTAVSKEGIFDYDIDLRVEDEARIVFVLSSEINQNLTAVLNGNVQYESVAGRSDVQGELKLLEGSTLEFIKTFQAAGSVRFESDITNPYLDITATYIDYYTPPDSAAGVTEDQVAVKIKIKGPLKELDQNFVKDENNIAVYYGEKAIEEDEPDPTKDPSDAVMFIITGRFTEDLNQREQSAAASQVTGAATSIAGSLLGGVLNQYLGEYVTGVELRRVGSETRFLFTGRAGAFRYRVGGSENVFENMSQANVRIEYPVYKGLSLRFERREDARERAVINEMINELGLRYRFEF